MRQRVLWLALLLALGGCGGGAERPTERSGEATAAPAEIAEQTPAKPTAPAQATASRELPADATPAANGPTPGAATSPPDISERVQGLRKLGERIEVDGVIYTLADPQQTDQPDTLHKANPGETYYLLDVTIENLGSAAPVAYNPLFLVLSDRDGYHYGVDALISPAALGAGKLQRDQQVQGKVIFRVAEDAHGLVVHYTPLTIGVDQTFSVALDADAGTLSAPSQGEHIQADGLTLTLAGIEPRTKLLTEPAAGHEFIALDVIVDNLARESLLVNPLAFKLLTEDGTILSPELSAGFRSLQSAFLGKGERNRGFLAFEVPQGSRSFTLVLKLRSGQPEIKLPISR